MLEEVNDVSCDSLVLSLALVSQSRGFREDGSLPHFCVSWPQAPVSLSHPNISPIPGWKAGGKPSKSSFRATPRESLLTLACRVLTGLRSPASVVFLKYCSLTSSLFVLRSCSLLNSKLLEDLFVTKTGLEINVCYIIQDTESTLQRDKKISSPQKEFHLQPISCFPREYSAMLAATVFTLR